MRVLMLALLLCISAPALAQDNPDLAALREADQSARRSPPDKVDWAVVNAQDKSRRDSVLAILKNGGVRTAGDYYSAALIMQHGHSPDDIRLAHSLATISATLDPTLGNAKWLVAASWDRLLQYMKQPQWYGTQYVKDANGKWALYPVLEGAVTDQERAALSVPSLQNARDATAAKNSRR